MRDPVPPGLLLNEGATLGLSGRACRPDYLRTALGQRVDQLARRVRRGDKRQEHLGERILHVVDQSRRKRLRQGSHLVHDDQPTVAEQARSAQVDHVERR